MRSLFTLVVVTCTIISITHSVSRKTYRWIRSNRIGLRIANENNKIGQGANHCYVLSSVKRDLFDDALKQSCKLSINYAKVEQKRKPESAANAVYIVRGTGHAYDAYEGTFGKGTFTHFVGEPISLLSGDGSYISSDECFEAVMAKLNENALDQPDDDEPESPSKTKKAKTAQQKLEDHLAKAEVVQESGDMDLFRKWQQELKELKKKVRQEKKERKQAAEPPKPPKPVQKPKKHDDDEGKGAHHDYYNLLRDYYHDLKVEAAREKIAYRLLNAERKRIETEFV